MNPRRRLGLWMGAVLLATLGAGLVLHATTTRAALQVQLDERNRSTANMLAALMSGAHGGTAALAAVAAAQFAQVFAGSFQFAQLPFAQVGQGG